MAYGDVGGSVTELVITCHTPDRDDINIKAGDAVALIGAYTIDNQAEYGDRIFGQALADCDQPLAAIPVKVRGICIFAIDNIAEAIYSWNEHGVVMSEIPGKVCHSIVVINAPNVKLKIDTGNDLVHVLL